MQSTTRGIAAALVLALFGVSAAPGLTPAQRCESGKLKLAGTYDLCRLKAEAKAVQKGLSPDYVKCDAKFFAKWSSTEAHGDGMCPSSNDVADLYTTLTQANDLVAWKLSGTSRFADQSNGTILDRQSGLQWEKQTELNGVANAGNAFDADNVYAWAGHCAALPSQACQPTAAAAALCATYAEYDTTGCDVCAPGDGPCDATATAWSAAAARNAASFAGHTDWRVPTRAELITLVDYASPTPLYSALDGADCGAACTDVANPACSCTQVAQPYWSASTLMSFTPFGVVVNFYDGSVYNDDKTSLFAVRLVRGAP